MRAEVKALLDPIVKALNEEDRIASELWAILSALRGPDTNDYALKEATTAVLRYKIGLRNYLTLCINAKDKLRESSKLPPETFKKPAELHFVNHFDNAVYAINQEE